MVITSKNAVYNEDCFYYFKKIFSLQKFNKANIKVTADARYKLYINKKLVSIGPCKTGEKQKYYEEIDVTDYLVVGENEIFAEVLQLCNGMEPHKHTFLCSVIRTGHIGLAMWGDVDGIENFVTDESWLVAKADNIHLEIPPYAFYGGLCECISKANDLKWESAITSYIVMENDVTTTNYGEITPYYVKKRPIPPLTLIESEFSAIDGNIYDVGRLVTGYINIKCRGNGEVKLTYSECYKDDNAELFDRVDRSGELYGDYDIFTVCGELCVQTFWFKTFRYITVNITGDVEIEVLNYAQSNYPLAVDSGYDFGSEDDNYVWKISLDTLINCMHETYEDCPYYEQLQYAMDTYLQMKYTFQISDDGRLARKTIGEFRDSINIIGISQSRCPSVTPQYIPGFALFFVMMVELYYHRFGDISIVTENIVAIDSVIRWFETRLDKNSLVKYSTFWDFVDWSPDFVVGVPQHEDGESSAVYTLMFAYILGCASNLHKLVGEHFDKYIALSERCKIAVKVHCFDEEKQLYGNGDRKKYFCQHTQIWAVLCGLDDIKVAQNILTNSFELKSNASLAYLYFLIRAMEKSNMYDKINGVLWQIYELKKMNCTTVPEELYGPRSECHAWGAVALYHFTANILGVQCCENGKNVVNIKPFVGDKKCANGVVCTRLGDVSVAWTVVENVFTMSVSANDDIIFDITLPNGIVCRKKGSCQVSCKV